jgi:hypothetical protein
MHVTIFDTNILRSLSDEKFAQINEREVKFGVRQFADPWTLMELIAHLRSIDDSAYHPCRAALRRCAERSLAPLMEPHRIVEPAEVQVSRTVFGNAIPWLEENFAALIELSRSIAFSESADNLAVFSEDIESIAQHVEEKEGWFTQYFGDLRQQVFEAAKSHTKGEMHAVVRSFTRSAEMFRCDAEALVKRAYRHADQQPPDPLPSVLINRVLATSQHSSAAVGLLLERIICDNANLEKSHIRNLLWDQEVAGSMGQTIDGLSVLLVTNDKFFAEAAKISGNEAAVFTLKEYLSQLGLVD